MQIETDPKATSVDSATAMGDDEGAIEALIPAPAGRQPTLCSTAGCWLQLRCCVFVASSFGGTGLLIECSYYGRESLLQMHTAWRV